MKSLYDRLLICDILECKKRESSCDEVKRYCDYCIDIIKSGISSMYKEVFQFLEMDEEINNQLIKEVNRIIKMYEEVEHLLKHNDALYKRYQHQLFTGFTDHLCESYYLFLKRHNKVTIPRHPGKRKSLKEYRSFLKRFNYSIREEYLFVNEKEETN